MTSPRHQVEISRTVEALDEEPDEPSIVQAVELVLNSLERPNSELSLRLVSEKEIVELNNTYRSKEGATNVLSFPADIQIEQVDILGDVVICPSVVAKEANDFGKTYADRFRHMLVHGVLHLLGYDHMEDQERERMETLEIRLLSQLGIENPYE
ncbi:MAG: rRNA maturation RNase YbeY [Pseudomonadales bacterium]|nr:rRNA maturation RNase YbeY [Pseudomonadales bacterium]MBO6597952.1 rRNA maturation RNase YbeY [Pseudomonadales bacterium]MBO6823026.1 rRNA maturation RNase YbeY [Pseudomonadales bacterium]